MKPIKNKLLAKLLLFGAILGGTSGALIMDEIIYQAARIVLGLSNEHFSSLLIPALALSVIGVIGTSIMFFAFKIENKKLKIWTLVFSWLVPTIIEIIDLSVKAILIFSELSQKNFLT